MPMHCLCLPHSVSSTDPFLHPCFFPHPSLPKPLSPASFPPMRVSPCSPCSITLLQVTAEDTWGQLSVLPLANTGKWLISLFQNDARKGSRGWKEDVVPSAPIHPLRVTVARALPQDFWEVPPALLLPGSFEDWHKERGHWLLWDFSFFC